MTWFTRHPITRMVVGYTMSIVSFVLTASSMISFISEHAPPPSSTPSDNRVLMIPLGFFALISSLFTLVYVKKVKETKEEHSLFISTQTGKKIAAVLQDICKKNNITMPLLTIDESNSSINASLRTTPHHIEISVGLYDSFEKNLITKNRLEAILAHELGHLHYQHIPKLSFVATTNFLNTIIFYGNVALSGVFILLQQMSQSTIASPFSLLELFKFWITKQLSEIGFHMVSRAQETQADISACQFIFDKKVHFLSMLENIEVQEKLMNSDECNNPLLHYYKSWLDTHPTASERREDIHLLAPTFRVVPMTLKNS